MALSLPPATLSTGGLNANTAEFHGLPLEKPALLDFGIHLGRDSVDEMIAEATQMQVSTQITINTEAQSRSEGRMDRKNKRLERLRLMGLKSFFLNAYLMK